MVRIFHIVFLLSKYAILYLLSKKKFIANPPQKLLRQFFEDAGGSFVKFGQLLSLRVDVVSKEYALEMLNLFDNIPPFPYRQVEEIFLQELGATPDKIFKDFQREPFASASFGQVHAAKLEDNRIVAVKVMRPSIEEKVAADFVLIDILAIIGDLFFKIDALPWKEFASEFKKWTSEELDYHIEAEHADILHKNLMNHPDIVIPKVYHHLSTKQILVEDYIEGIPLSRVLQGLKDGRLDAAKMKKFGIDIKKVPSTLVIELLREFFLDGVFHADPHPGNILLLKDNKIALIDFGIIGDSQIYNKTSFVKAIQGYANMDFKKAVYNSADFLGDNLKQMIASALPASVSEKHIDEFIEILANHFTDSVYNIVMGSIKDLEVMKKDYTVVYLQIVNAAKRYKAKLPKETVMFIRTLSIVGFLAKELDYEFRLTEETKHFFKKYPESSWLKEKETAIPYKRISHERAIDQLNSWLAYLAEIDPGLYQLVNQYIKKYNFIDK